MFGAPTALEVSLGHKNSHQDNLAVRLLFRLRFSEQFGGRSACVASRQHSPQPPCLFLSGEISEFTAWMSISYSARISATANDPLASSVPRVTSTKL